MNMPLLTDGPFVDDFYPFSLTRSVADIRCGILTLREKWHFLVRNHTRLPAGISVPANIIPDESLLLSLESGLSKTSFPADSQLVNVSDILRLNNTEIKKDFKLITAERKTEPISVSNKILGSEIFLEPGAIVEHCFLNATDGPIYIGRDALVMEGSMIRGPFAIGEKGVVKMGAKIYGATSAGPHCVLGGEIKNSIIFGYSNKAHDGYLGDSVVGEWCNLGAGTSNSNLKNSGGPVKLWNPIKKTFLNAGIKSGLMMGDYSRSAIQTAFNTGTVVGICCHVFGNGITPSYLPSFSWGYDQTEYKFEKAIEHISKWKKFKGLELTSSEIQQLRIIFDQQKQLK